jgi:NRPS condensation-like uncharacterized protein
MGKRALSPVERMVDVFERASTLTFTTAVTLRGGVDARGCAGEQDIDASALEQALRKLERLHPLLRARIERADAGMAFVFDQAAPIPLRILEGPPAAIWELARSSLEHRVWPDQGPRAELTWLRHAPDRCSLLLSLHHLVSDGSSGIFALRDLLRLLAQPQAQPEPLHVPSQSAFYPRGHGNLRWKLRAGALVAHALFGEKPHRLRVEPADPDAPRSVGLTHLRLAAPQMQALMRRARADRATVHGVLSAAIARAISDEAQAEGSGDPIKQSILHAVDLRRYLKAYYPGSNVTPDAVGYYVSSLQTAHRVQSSGPLGPLAREITEAVRAKKAQGEPLLAGPIAGEWITRRAPKTGDLRGFRRFVEQQVMLDTFSITNLGPLENLGIQPSVGRLQVEDCFFVAAGSVFTTLLVSATTFGGALTMPIGWVEPLVARELAERVVRRAELELSTYAAQVTEEEEGRAV